MSIQGVETAQLSRKNRSKFADLRTVQTESHRIQRARSCQWIAALRVLLVGPITILAKESRRARECKSTTAGSEEEDA